MAKTGDAAAMRAALEEIDRNTDLLDIAEGVTPNLHPSHSFVAVQIRKIARAALAAPPRKGRWKNGKNYEYEYAYCSECGRMQWAGWDTHKQAEDNIRSFADDYKFCPGCGAEMEGGEYVK